MNLLVKSLVVPTVKSHPNLFTTFLNAPIEPKPGSRMTCVGVSGFVDKIIIILSGFCGFAFVYMCECQPRIAFEKHCTI